LAWSKSSVKSLYLRWENRLRKEGAKAETKGTIFSGIDGMVSPASAEYPDSAKKKKNTKKKEKKRGGTGGGRGMGGMKVRRLRRRRAFRMDAT